MSHARLLLRVCELAVIVAAPAASQPDKKLPFAGLPPPQELQVLAPLVGQWTTKWEIRPSLQDKQGYTGVGQMTGQWLHNRHFLRLESTMTGNKQVIESTILYSYDAKKKVYRRWLFASTSLVTESEGQWDEAKRTMTWKARHVDAGVSGGITDVLEQDRITTSVFFKRADGTVLSDLSVVAERKK